MKEKYFIKEELVGGKPYFMIYKRIFFFWEVFFERWVLRGSAETRLKELLNK